MENDSRPWIQFSLRSAVTLLLVVGVHFTAFAAGGAFLMLVAIFYTLPLVASALNEEPRSPAK